MNIFKFGGASVRNAEGVKQVLNIVTKHKEDLIIVVSAMDKTTNALEKLSYKFYKGENYSEDFNGIANFHINVIKELFGNKKEQNIYKLFNSLFENLREILKNEPSLCYDYEYDRIVSFGELFSTTIISEYLKNKGKNNKFIDIRKCLITDENYRNANVNWELSKKLCKQIFIFDNCNTYVTQGFIAGTPTNQNTTLGREGSDYTAALLANILDSKDVTIWKDVPGIMNADPRMYKDTITIPFMSYKEAIELANCGAKIIHPKTIKPLENKQITLYVKSFLEPENAGSIIKNISEKINLPPVYITKFNQLLLSLTPRDFSFIAEEELSHIFNTLAKFKLNLNLMQISAISFSFCIDNNNAILNDFIQELKKDFEVLYNTNVKLLTIRHYNDSIIHELLKNENRPLVEQRSRLTARFVLSNK